MNELRVLVKGAVSGSWAAAFILVIGMLLVFSPIGVAMVLLFVNPALLIALAAGSLYVLFFLLCLMCLLLMWR